MDTHNLKLLLDDYVDSGKLPGYNIAVWQRDRELAYLEYGAMDVARGKPVTRDSIFRIYSMTKPITSVALMQLYERGSFNLDDPVEKYIPSWRDLKIHSQGDGADRLANTTMTIRHLLTHTAGLTYGFNPSHPVDRMYLDQEIYDLPEGKRQVDRVEMLSDMPLCFEPGSAWNYSFATDVAGHLVEEFSGQSLDAYFQDYITGPLGMVDTDFHVRAENRHRFACCYAKHSDADGFKLQDDADDSAFLQPESLLSGGGGLVSTIDDYLLFCRAILNQGKLGDTQILQAQTVELMSRNHLPDGKDLGAMGQSVFLETVMEGVGFGLGYAVVLEPERAGILAPPGELSWGGMASTYHFLEPQSGLVAVFMTQLIPSSSWPIRVQMKNLIYEALS